MLQLDHRAYAQMVGHNPNELIGRAHADGIHPDVVIESGTRGPQEAPRVTRERDLPGHLAAEGPQGGGSARDAGAIFMDGGTGDEVSGMLARDVPVDPSSSPDVVLRVGYQMLKAQIASKSTFTR